MGSTLLGIDLEEYVSSSNYHENYPRVCFYLFQYDFSIYSNIDHWNTDHGLMKIVPRLFGERHDPEVRATANNIRRSNIRYYVLI